VEIVTERRNAVLRLPTEAMLENDRVYLFDTEAGALRERKIEVGLSNWNWTEVREGLRTGDRVVVSLAQEGLEDGATAVPARETTQP
jgi:HlyD family secretion protein